ncbi:chloramphenicol acetyltransferase [Companilactobacillus crustorum]|uniref:Chloramphenicol acetyltransferase n=3 Tax=Companilactobacillus TaxID=2767879 RepID=A0A837RGE2_9LACO|nr:CatA-like O-acetyltransferase [Companilactobacillus crustorum]KRK42258.1 chloramphenicol acetyltransferase [Companilactobacillus crustorum JCM 15951]KRO20214.1 chloramphenicol acetyltransferase [Companilactobacillus crustorum]GEO76794.1 chloramphenicol acetyltransferase [Companilactobacillus crustorum]
MTFTKIDLDTWTRKEVFNHYIGQKTTYSMTHDISIAKAVKFAKDNNYNFYPLFIYTVLKVINSNYLYRMDFDDQGELGYYDTSVPFYSVFDSRTELFSNIYSQDTYTFAEFNRNYLVDVKGYRGMGKLFPQEEIPKNVVNISMIPWINYSSFNLNVNNKDNYLLPIVTAGKFERAAGDIKLPVSFQIHHAVCDGYQTAQFFNKLQDLMDQPEKL